LTQPRMQLTRASGLTPGHQNTQLTALRSFTFRLLSGVYQSILGWPVSTVTASVLSRPLALIPKPQFLISNAGPGVLVIWAPTPKHLQSTVSVPAHWPRPGRGVTQCALDSQTASGTVALHSEKSGLDSGP
jgi:hypothetical protein